MRVLLFSSLQDAVDAAQAIDAHLGYPDAHTDRWASVQSCPRGWYLPAPPSAPELPEHEEADAAPEWFQTDPDKAPDRASIAGRSVIVECRSRRQARSAARVLVDRDAPRKSGLQALCRALGLDDEGKVSELRKRIEEAT